MYYGCRRTSTGWKAACQELSFHHFRKRCHAFQACAGAFLGYISPAWAEQAVKPQQEVPGSDQGVTEHTYRALMEHCDLQAAFMIEQLRLTPTGRLYVCDTLSSTSQVGNLVEQGPHPKENPNLREYWQLLRHQRQKQTSVFNEISDSETECSDPPGSSDYSDDLPHDLAVPASEREFAAAPAAVSFCP